MRFFTLHAHEREIMSVKFNRDSDWLFTVAGDKEAMVWDVATGERIGTFQGGHAGAILCCDIDFNTQNFLTGGGDGSICMWNAQNGEMKARYEATKGRIKSIEWHPDDRRFLAAVMPVKIKQQRMICIYDPMGETEDDDGKEMIEEDNEAALEKTIMLDGDTDSILAIWSANGTEIYCAVTPRNRKPHILVIDAESGEITREIQYAVDANQPGTGEEPDLTSIRLIPNKCAVLVSSRDHTVRLYDTREWTCIQTYTTDRPINASLFHPERDLLIATGGLKAQQAALQGGGGKYTVVFYSTVFASQVAEFMQTQSIGFSPINAMDISRDGTYLACGHHEGDCRLFKFDKNFWKEVDSAERAFLASSGY